MVRFMIEFQQVSFRYTGDAPYVIHRMSFSIAKGECVIFSGDNGSGKSTALKIVNGLLFPSEGEYRFAGQAIDRKQMEPSAFSKEFHQKIGFVFQNPEVQLFNASVFDELAFGPRQMGLPEAEIHRRVEDALRLLDISRLRDCVPYALSGGEKRRVAIASVLTMNPSVWTLDEPETFLDENGRVWLAEFLDALKRAKKTVLIATHDRTLQSKLADQIIVFRRPA